MGNDPKGSQLSKSEDEARLVRLTKSLLAMPHKPREESKIRKAKLKGKKKPALKR